ncbi:MAG: hypothetical protein ABSF18_06725 [Gammaproteobacteria bacterium]
MGKVTATSISKKDPNLLVLYIPTAQVNRIDDLLTFFMDGTSVDGGTAVFNTNDLLIEPSKTAHAKMAASIEPTWIAKESQQIETHAVRADKNK